MLVKSGFSLRSGNASSSIDKGSSGEFEDHSIGGASASMIMSDDDALSFREPNTMDLHPAASHTRTSLGHTATLVSLGELRLSSNFGELRQQSVPTMLAARARGGGESGFLIEEEKGVEHGSEATPTPPREQRGGEEVMLHESQSTLKGSFGYATYLYSFLATIK